MPEVFEVKRMATYLRDGGIVGQTIQDISSFCGAKILKQFSLQRWQQILKGQTILAIDTKAKYTFIKLTAGELVWHYRFTGIPFVTDLLDNPIDYGTRLFTLYHLPVEKPGRYIRFSITLEDKKIFFSDMRSLSTVEYFCAKRSLRHKLPADFSDFSFLPFDEWQKTVKAKRDIKTELQDQYTIPSGIGNYLACEILAHAMINPWQKLGSFDKKLYERLCGAMQTVQALCLSSARYDWMLVFKNKICGRCGGAVQRRKHKGASSQSTHFCKRCQ